jgi:hypothetical protein
MKIGIDLGNTIVHNPTREAYPRALEVIKNLVEDGHEIWIISRVNSEQRAKSLEWIEKFGFFQKTGIKPDNLYYCWERKDKAIFGKAFSFDVFIDDHPEVLSHFPDQVLKLAFRPKPEKVQEYSSKMKNYYKIEHWPEIREKLMIFCEHRFEDLDENGLSPKKKIKYE